MVILELIHAFAVGAHEGRDVFIPSRPVGAARLSGCGGRPL